MTRAVARRSLKNVRQIITDSNQACSRTVLEQSHLNSLPYFTASTYIGPRLVKVRVFKGHEKALVRRLFGPGVAIPWGSLERTGRAEVRAPIFSETAAQ